MARYAPLMLTAYIDAAQPAQQGQEATVAKYPLVVTGSTVTTLQNQWRATVKALNPDIKILGYVLGNERSTQFNPGRAIWQALPVSPAVECNFIYNGLTHYPTLTNLPGGFRLFDYRYSGYTQALIDVIGATINSQAGIYDGVFIDNCTVFTGAQPSSYNGYVGDSHGVENYPGAAAIRAEMLEALQETLTAARAAFPDIMILGNSSFNFTHINGEMNEGRPEDYAAELPSIPGQTLPGLNVGMLLEPSGVSEATIIAAMNTVHSYDGIFTYSRNFQHAEWFDFYDPIMAAWEAENAPDPENLPIRIQL